MKFVVLGAALALSACASANTIQTSANTAIIQAGAAPACGAAGAARVAQKQAAVATLQAGFDRYIIVDAASQNNVRMVQGAGTYQTTAVRTGNWVNATTTYQPGPMMAAGSHDQSFSIRMFRDSEPGANMAISARSVLGPEWQTEMNKRTMTCT